MSKELNKMRKIIHEAGYISDTEFFRNHKNRKRLHRQHPDSFLGVNAKGVPVFPVRNQYGGMSILVLRRSLSAAKRLYRQTGNHQYIDIIEKLKIYIKGVENKVMHLPINYKIHGELERILQKTRDLGSLSNLGKANIE